MKKCHSKKGGFTYVELIVVLSIFAVMSSVILFNYKGYQEKVDMRTLANQVALRLVQAQKYAVGGKIPPRTTVTNWKPSYGVYFSTSTAPGNDADSKDFVFFTDLDNNKIYGNGSGNGSCSSGTGECLEKISISRGSYVKGISMDGTTPIIDLYIIFTRPDSGAYFSSATGPISGTYAEITLSSATGSTTSIIDVYPSGRIQLK